MPTKAGYAAIIGRPNVGKSTLLNNIIGTKLSIVTHKPQTTRKRVLGIFTSENSQVIFLDTPGILEPKYELQKSMMNYVESSIDEADILIVIIDISRGIDFEEMLPTKFLNQLKEIEKPKILILNKIDLLKNVKESLPVIEYFAKMDVFQDIMPIAAIKQKSGVGLVKVLDKYLPESPFFYDPEVLSIQPEKFFVSEIIRETVFLNFKEEIPYSTEIQIREFKEREVGKWYIAADIIIERQSQKAIIIGTGGEQIKKIGEKARTLIEVHLDMPVYLELFVKVREHWRNDKNLLTSFGYS